MTYQFDKHFKKNKPSKKELIFLNLAYNRFFDLYKKFENYSNPLSSEEKFSLLKNILQIYSECLKYEPIKYYLKFLAEKRPLGDTTSLKYFEVIRHILVHFPFFNKWDDVYFTQELIIWNGNHSKINSFFLDNEGKEEFKWRVWDENEKMMKYGYVIKFPNNYSKNSKIYIKDLIDEVKGIEISLLMIKRVLESQVYSVKNI